MDRERKAREVKYASTGNQGRRTGVAAPQNVPVNSNGFQDVDAFFQSPTSTGRPSTKGGTVKKGASGARTGGNLFQSKTTHPTSSVSPSSTKDLFKDRRKPRQDRFHEIGQRGRKTGITPGIVPRNSDGIENVRAFYDDQSVELARRRASRALTDDDGFTVDDGQDDMELDSTGSNLSPRTYMAKRARMSSVSRLDESREQADMGFDTLPTRPVKRPSKGSSSKSAYDVDAELRRAEEEEEEDEEDDDDEDNDNDAENLPSSPIKRITKGKRSSKVREEEFEPNLEPQDEFVDPVVDFNMAGEVDDPDPGNDHDVAGFDDDEGSVGGVPEPIAEGDSDVGDEHADELLQRPHDSRKRKASPKKQPRSKKTLPPEPDDVRRSHRFRTAPLDHWRNERLVYARRQSGGVPHYGIKGVVRVPKPDAVHLSSARKRRGGSRHRSQSAVPRGKSVTRDVSEENADYEGWDDATDPDGLVWDYATDKEATKRIAFTAKMVQPGARGKHSYRFQKIFMDAQYMAGGVLEIPIGESKPLKPARDNSYIFYVARGAIRALIYRTEVTVAEGGFLMVPRGNQYKIDNISDVDDARLVFMQGREVPAEDYYVDDEENPDQSQNDG